MINTDNYLSGEINDAYKTFIFVREGMGISQEEMAKIHGVSRFTISLWESGKRTPKAKTMLWYLVRANDFNIKIEEVPCGHCKGTGKIKIVKIFNRGIKGQP